MVFGTVSVYKYFIQAGNDYFSVLMNKWIDVIKYSLFVHIHFFVRILKKK